MYQILCQKLPSYDITLEAARRETLSSKLVIRKINYFLNIQVESS